MTVLGLRSSVLEGGTGCPADVIAERRSRTHGATTVQIARRKRLRIIALLALWALSLGTAATYVWLNRFMRIARPDVPPIDVYTALIDDTPVTVTFPAGTESITLRTTADEVGSRCHALAPDEPHELERGA